MRVIGTAAIIVVLSVVPAAAQDPPCEGNNRGDFERRATNMQHVVEQVAQQYPDDFRLAHTEQFGGDRFIKRLAWALHQIDPLWGLNGKRGSSTDLSLDVVARLNDSVDFLERPDLEGSEAFDVIVRAGDPTAAPGWSEITCEFGAGGRWIKPEPIDGTSPQPPTVPQPDPVLTKKVLELEAQAQAFADRLNGFDALVNQLRSDVEGLSSIVGAIRVPIGCEGRLWGAFDVRCGFKY